MRESFTYGSVRGAAGKRRSLPRSPRKFCLRPSIWKAAVVIADQGVTSTANFLSGVLIAWACTKAEYGTYVLTITVARLLVGVQNSLIGLPYTIYFPRCNIYERPMYRGGAILHQLVLSFFFLSVTVVSAGSAYFFGATPTTVDLLTLLAAVSFAFSIRDYVRLTLLAELRVYATFAVSFCCNLLSISVILGLYYSGTLSVSFSLLAITAGSAIPTAVALIWQARRSRFHKRLLIQDLFTRLNVGKWILARSLANSAAVSLVPLLLAATGGAAEVGVYGACLAIASVINPVFMGVGAYLRPQMSHLAVQDFSAARRLALLVSASIGMLTIVCVSIAMGWGDVLMTTIYGPAYSNATCVLVVMFLATGVMALGSPILIAIDSSGRTNVSFWGRLAGLVFVVFFGPLLIWKFGALGAAISLLLSHTASAACWYFAVAGQEFELLNVGKRGSFRGA